MSTTITLTELTGAADGAGVKVAATSTPGTTIHTADSTAYDRVCLWAVNNDADGEPRSLTVEWGGTTDPDNVMTKWILADVGFVPVTPESGLILTNSLVVKAFADEANDVVIYGHVLRVTQS